jgi:hypothetical protein
MAQHYHNSTRFDTGCGTHRCSPGNLATEQFLESFWAAVAEEQQLA